MTIRSQNEEMAFSQALVSPLIVSYIYLICCDAKENSSAIKRIEHYAAIIYDGFFTRKERRIIKVDIIVALRLLAHKSAASL